MARLLRITGRIALAVLGFAVLVIVGVIVAVNVSPKPFASLVRKQFDTGIGVAPVTPAIYDELSRGVRAEKDVEYPSRFENNRLDVFSPNNATGPLPTFLWAHGGGFVGGDKAGIETWATMIAAHGYTVVSINYELAPRTRYPSPIVQLGEAYEFLKREPRRFPIADLHRLIVGGDSAGAQIASQFVALQTNAALASSMRYEPIVPKEEMIGVVLYCGPYDLKSRYDSKTWFGRFFVRQLGWAYFGVRAWRDTPQATQASTVESVTPDYPPAFITDGNSGSFEEDARKLEAELKKNGVYVESLFYPVDQRKLGHEYQFDFSVPESMQAYDRTLQFLDKILSP